MRFGICDFETLAICDFIPRFFCDFSAEPAVRVAILNLRFQNASDCDCDFLGRLVRGPILSKRLFFCRLKTDWGVIEPDWGRLNQIDVPVRLSTVEYGWVRWVRLSTVEYGWVREEKGQAQSQVQQTNLSLVGSPGGFVPIVLCFPYGFQHCCRWETSWKVGLLVQRCLPLPPPAIWAGYLHMCWLYPSHLQLQYPTYFLL